MRRKQFVQTVGLTEKALSLLVERKLVPMRGKKPLAGWAEYTFDDALALECAIRLSRLGLSKARARDVVDAYFDLALERAQEVGRPRASHIYLGMVQYVAMEDGFSTVDDHWPLVGTPTDIAEEIERLSESVGPSRWVEGELTVNVHLCMAAVSQRAQQAGIVDDRLVQLEQWFAR
jgi:hypothetical protein